MDSKIINSNLEYTGNLNNDLMDDVGNALVS